MKKKSYKPNTIRKKVPKILITSCISGYFIKVDINTEVNQNN